MPTPDLVNTLRRDAVDQITRLQRIVDVLDAEFPRPGRPRASANGRRKTATTTRRRRRRTKAPAAA